MVFLNTFLQQKVQLSHDQLPVCLGLNLSFPEVGDNLFQQRQEFPSPHHLSNNKAEVVPRLRWSKYPNVLNKHCSQEFKKNIHICIKPTQIKGSQLLRCSSGFSSLVFTIPFPNSSLTLKGLAIQRPPAALWTTNQVLIL